MKWDWIFGAVFILFGLVLCIWGRKLFVYIVFIFGTLITTALILLACYSTFLDTNTSKREHISK